VSIFPLETAAHFGWLEIFVGRDPIGSRVQTQARLGWRRTGAGTVCRPRTNVLFGDHLRTVYPQRRYAHAVDWRWPAEL